MTVLRDLVPDRPTVLVCGTAVATASAARGHYYAGRGNQFWELLYGSGLIPVPLTPDNDHRIVEFGIGLTDLVKDVTASSDRGLRQKHDVRRLIRLVEDVAPRWVAFHGKEAAGAVSAWIGRGRKAPLGRQAWRLGPASVFVLPNASGANRDRARLEGKADRRDWFVELRRIIGAEDAWRVGHRCPVCDEGPIVPITYGLPGPQTLESAQRGEVSLGGCCVTNSQTTRACRSCGHEWRHSFDIVED